MNLEHYDYFTNSAFKDYEFFSEGPKGKIKKSIHYTKLDDADIPIHNLAFGDQNTATNSIDDLIVSNNKDKDLVLATVAHTIDQFCSHHLDQYVFAAGSTPARTRLYQMGISRLWDQISVDFDLLGLKNHKWLPFKYGINYDAFMVKKKK